MYYGLRGKKMGDMKQVSVFIKSIEVELKTGPDICDITQEIRQLIKESQIKTGNLNATIVGSTGSLTSIPNFIHPISQYHSHLK